jgi:hypothetical protein
MAPSGRGWQRGKTTAQRGLGSEHQKARKRLLAELKDGDPCARCGGPMYRGWPRLLEVDDFPPRSIAVPLGIKPEKRLSHKLCNRRAGAALSARLNAMRRGQEPGTPKYSRWLSGQHVPGRLPVKAPAM